MRSGDAFSSAQATPVRTNREKAQMTPRGAAWNDHLKTGKNGVQQLFRRQKCSPRLFSSLLITSRNDSTHDTRATPREAFHTRHGTQRRTHDDRRPGRGGRRGGAGAAGVRGAGGAGEAASARGPQRAVRGVQRHAGGAGGDGQEDGEEVRPRCVVLRLACLLARVTYTWL
jgi:hypothetical protein